MSHSDKWDEDENTGRFPSAKEVLDKHAKLCPRCLAKDHLKIKLTYEHMNAFVYLFWRSQCPRCGWEPRLASNRFIYFMFERPILGYGPIRKHSNSPFGWIIFAGITWLLVTQIIPQALNSIG